MALSFRRSDSLRTKFCFVAYILCWILCVVFSDTVDPSHALVVIAVQRFIIVIIFLTNHLSLTLNLSICCELICIQHAQTFLYYIFPLTYGYNIVCNEWSIEMHKTLQFNHNIAFLISSISFYLLFRISKQTKSLCQCQKCVHCSFLVGACMI